MRTPAKNLGPTDLTLETTTTQTFLVKPSVQDPSMEELSLSVATLEVPLSTTSSEPELSNKHSRQTVPQLSEPELSSQELVLSKEVSESELSKGLNFEHSAPIVPQLRTELSTKMRDLNVTQMGCMGVAQLTRRRTGLVELFTSHTGKNDAWDLPVWLVKIFTGPIWK